MSCVADVVSARASDGNGTNNAVMRQTIQETLAGDVNDTGKVNTLDRIILARYLA